MNDSSPRRIAILGGSSGIGLATAKLAALHGARVILGGRNQARLSAAATQVDGASTVLVDAEDAESLRRFYEAAGPLDHLVITVTRRDGGAPASQLAETDLVDAFAGKAAAQLRAVSLALPTLSATGSITLLTGSTAQASLPGTALAASVNGALESAVPSLAREIAPQRINAVSPGVIDTEWWDALGDAREMVLTAMAQQTPLGRTGTAHEVAAAILALVENDFITGVVLPVDGGLRLT